MTYTNPLENTVDLPDYGAIRPAHVVPALTAELARCRTQLADLLAQPSPTFATLVEPVEQMHHRLARLFAPISHLNAVANNEELRTAYNICLPLLAEYHAEVGQNDALYRAYEAVQKLEGPPLDPQRQRVLAYALREFRLAGVHLPPAEKARYKELMQELATLQSRFEENVLDATQAYLRPVTDEAELEGLPAHVIGRARDTAASRGERGHTLPLDYPTYAAVMNHAHSVALRRDFYEAWYTRASDQGPSAGRFDNGTVMAQVLAARHEAARLLGYANYADLSLATKMAPDTPAVIGFLDELAERYLPGARAEYAELEAYAGRSLEPWDVGYYSELLRTERFNVSEERLRPWFPLPRVLQGMFGAALVPLSQTTLMNINTPAQQGSAMALWGVAVMDSRSASGRPSAPGTRTYATSPCWPPTGGRSAASTATSLPATTSAVARGWPRCRRGSGSAPPAPCRSPTSSAISRRHRRVKQRSFATRTW